MRTSWRQQATLIIALMVLSSGCATITEIAPEAISQGELPSLTPDQGILLLDLDTTVPLELLATDRGAVATQIDAGEHLRLFVVSAGRYRWARFDVPVSRGTMRFRARRLEMWDFSVEPGVINYPGSLVLRGNTSRWHATLEGLHINRAARTHEALRSKFPAVVSEYELVYSGHDRDDFLQHYTAALREAAAGDE